MRLPEREKRERAEKLFKEMMAENFSNLGREMDIQIQKAEIISNIINPKKPNLRHIIIIKLSNLKDKERLLKVA